MSNHTEDHSDWAYPHKQRAWYASRRVVSVLGAAIIAGALFSEVISRLHDGLGPYQIGMILIGLLLVVLGWTRSASWGERTALVSLSFILTLGAIEIILGILPRIAGTGVEATLTARVQDDYLTWRISPNRAGHDSRGWRNSTALAQSWIVAIGDSQTWGVNAGVKDTWPSQLSEITGESVYNMSLGGYGPVQYWQLTGEALELSPDYVIVGLYFGNDFFDTCNVVYTNEHYRDLRTAIDIDPEKTFQVIEAANERRDQFIAKILSEDRKHESIVNRFKEDTNLGRFLDSRGFWPKWLSTSDEDVTIQTALRDWSVIAPDETNLYDDGEVVTFFSPLYRLTAVDTQDPCIAEGVDITRTLLLRINSQVEDAAARLVVLLIPTKDLVYSDLMVEKQDGMSSTYSELITRETAIRNDMMQFLHDHQVEYIDSLPALQAAASNHIPIYTPTDDGHPTPLGYRVLAEVVAAGLEQ